MREEIFICWAAPQMWGNALLRCNCVGVVVVEESAPSHEHSLGTIYDRQGQVGGLGIYMYSSVRYY